MFQKAIRVLIVDDEPELVGSLRKRMLRRGFTVVGTLSGRKALAAAELRRFDVAVIDLKMPEMDGLETLKRLKSLQPTVQAIILTGHGSVEAALQSGRLAATYFLPKPFDFSQLVEFIQKAATEGRTAQRELYQRELQKVVSSYRTPQEIMEACAQLREQYEQ